MDLNKEAEEITSKQPEIFSNEEDMVLHSKDNPFSLPLRIDSFVSDKELIKFIRCVPCLAEF